MRCVSVVTPVGRLRPDLWLEAAESLESVRDSLPDGWELQWCVHLDGLDADAFFASEAFDLTSSYVTVTYAERMGIAVARNCALVGSEGDLIGSLDDDDRFTLGWVELVRTLERDDSLVWAAGHARDIDEDGEFLRAPLVELEEGRVAAGVMVDGYLSGGWDGWLWPWHGCAAVVRVVGGWAGVPWSEDTSMWLAISEMGDGWHSKQVVYEWRKHRQSTTLSGFREKTDSFWLPSARSRAEALRDFRGRRR